MPMEIQLTAKESDYLEKLDQIAEDAIKNPNKSPGIFVEQHAGNIPDVRALLYKNKSWSWKELNQESNKIANYFLEKGNQPNDTFAMMMENSPEYLFVTTGINKIQGITSQINVNLRKTALIHAFNTSEPKRIILDGDNIHAFNEIFDELKFNKENVFVLNNPNNIQHDFIDLHELTSPVSTNNPKTTFNSDLADMSMYIFTSGTTGLPKAALQSNARLLNPFGFLAFELTQSDVVYSPLPLYHSLATVVGWGGVLHGGCTFAIRKRFSASQFWKDIRKFGATCFLYIGELPRYLLNRPKSEYIPNNTLKKMLGVGLRKDIWEEFKSRFHIEHILEFYGATEGAGGLFNIQEVSGMIGRIVVPDSIEIVRISEETGEFYKDENSFYIKCIPGETGMMLAKILPEGTFLGYKDKNKTDERVLKDVFEKGDAYFNTGDLVTLHEDNWVSFADRYGDTFRWKGENVSTLEVESIINCFDNLEMCTVYGVEIPNSEGKAGMTSIKLSEKHSFDLATFSQFIFENLPKYAIPLFLRITDNLEFTGTHKLRKINLRKQGFDITNIQDQIYFWNPESNRYEDFDKKKYNHLMNNML
ncbi:MAG: long-chain-acyl-CoA synthetase [Promethearchaeota archaeon]